MLSKEEIRKEIENMDAWIPIYEIEKRLGMPPTTLQKVLSGNRELPKKWKNVLEAYFLANKKVTSKSIEIKESPLKTGIVTNKKSLTLSEQLELRIK